MLNDLVFVDTRSATALHRNPTGFPVAHVRFTQQSGAISAADWIAPTLQN